jgi:NADPH-dependent glutamate synthase beta subunit-like oxidoreductase
MGNHVSAEGHVAVVGGGNAAVDVARSALRLGANDVTVIYRRERDQMPASPEEVEDMLQEGVKVEFLAVPVKMDRKKSKVNITCQRMKLGKLDSDGRRKTVPVEGSEFNLTVDTVVTAIGQVSENSEKFGIAVRKNNTFIVDDETLVTDREGVFAGGDAATGPATVIEAIAAGRKAAVAIDKYLGGNGEIEEKLTSIDDVTGLPELEEGEHHRISIPCLPVTGRLNDFIEVELSLTEKAAIEEAGRCLRCDLEED